MHRCKYYSFITSIVCITLIIPALWFPSWNMYATVACIRCLVALPVIFLLIMVLFVIIWALTCFMMKGEN